MRRRNADANIVGMVNLVPKNVDWSSNGQCNFNARIVFALSRDITMLNRHIGTICSDLDTGPIVGTGKDQS